MIKFVSNAILAEEDKVVQIILLQACAFRDSYEKFKKAGAEVVGISGDDTSSHKVIQVFG